TDIPWLVIPTASAPTSFGTGASCSRPAPPCRVRAVALGPALGLLEELAVSCPWRSQRPSSTRSIKPASARPASASRIRLIVRATVRTVNVLGLRRDSHCFVLIVRLAGLELKRLV